MAPSLARLWPLQWLGKGPITPLAMAPSLPRLCPLHWPGKEHHPHPCAGYSTSFDILTHNNALVYVQFIITTNIILYLLQ